MLKGIIIHRCVRIHSRTGPGCFEKVYADLLNFELVRIGLDVKMNLVLPLMYETIKIEKAYKLDMLVENMLLIELKASEQLHAVIFEKVRSQLDLLDLRHGLILNFKVPLMREGVHHLMNFKGRMNLEEAASF